MIKILHVLGGPLDRGGITTFLKNYISFMDKSIFEFTILCQGSNLSDVEHEFKQLGVHVITIPYKSENLIKNLAGLSKTIKQGHFDIVHCHEDAMNILPVVMTKILSNSRCIMHSHNSDHTSGSIVKRKVYDLLIKVTGLFDCERIACSSAAGAWLFGKKKFHILENAIDVRKYSFKDRKRNEIREQYALDDKIVIGFIGRVDHQKNPGFILELAKRMAEKNKNIFFLVIGGGKDLNKYSDLAKDLNNILFIGPKPNVSDYLNAFDIFVMPSHFEGLGIAAIEAQSNGLYCLLSEHVPTEAKVTDNVEFIKLDLDLWEQSIVTLSKHIPTRFKTNLEGSEYDISKASDRLAHLYQEFLK